MVKQTHHGGFAPSHLRRQIQVILTDSSLATKKYTSIIMDGIGQSKVHFGHPAYEDYTMHRDSTRKQKYLKRHNPVTKQKRQQDWTIEGIHTAGFWSRWLLWNKPSIEESIADIRRRFGIRIENKINYNLTDAKLKQIINQQKEHLGTSIYAPVKYFKGLSRVETIHRLHEMIDRRTNPSNAQFKTNTVSGKPRATRLSSYTERFRKKYPNAKSLKQKADATGVPLEIIQKVYDRGVAAWSTGHRPGATAQQWGYARVHSFLTHGKTYHTADADLAKAVNRLQKRGQTAG